MTVSENGFLGTTQSGAVFSRCNKYRWTLWRRWNGLLGNEGERLMAFIGLNPSTANEYVDDPTIRRCIRFAKRWQFDGMVMLNLFGWRDTDPKGMKVQAEPVGELNDAAILHVTSIAALTVCCWGVHGSHNHRSAFVRGLLASRPLAHMGLTADGEPRHPLYLPNDVPIAEWIFQPRLENLPVGDTERP